MKQSKLITKSQLARKSSISRTRMGRTEKAPKLRKSKLASIGRRRKREEPALRIFRRELRKRCEFEVEGEKRWKCERCPRVVYKATDIDPHHIAMRSRVPNFHDAEANGAGLCFECHNLIHFHPNRVPDLERWLR